MTLLTDFPTSPDGTKGCAEATSSLLIEGIDIPAAVGGVDAVGDHNGRRVDIASHPREADLETIRSATRICYVHVGTHKTGTTSIQRFLALNRDRFADAGVLLPRAGCDNSPEYVSHHQLAYDLTANPLFDPQYGGLDAFAEELEHSDAPIASGGN